MDPSERANLPRWSGSEDAFEIWFAVIFDPEARRAYWIRYSLMAPAPGSSDAPSCVVWAAAFDADRDEPVVFGKRVLPIAAFNRGRTDLFQIRMGDALLAHGRLEGSIDAGGHSLSWRLRFRPKVEPVRRAPSVLDFATFLPRADHAHDRVAFDGEVVVDGATRELRGAVGMQAHIYGKRQVDEILWVYGHALEDTLGRPGHVELIASRFREEGLLAPLPSMMSLHLEREGKSEVAQLGVSGAATLPRPGALDFRVSSALRAVHLRAWADPREMAGYVYRDPRGHQAWVAQSDIASCEIEIFERDSPFARFRPTTRLVSLGRSALEIHVQRPIDGVRYIQLGEEAPPPRPTSASSPSSRRGALGTEREDRSPYRGADQRGSSDTENEGGWVLLETPHRIFALGLTYDDHARETGSRARTEVFEKPIRTWLPVEGEARVALPTPAEVDRTLDEIQPSLASRVHESIELVPLLMDYEVELGVMLLDDVATSWLEKYDPARDDADEGAPRLAFFVANDLTARSVQILGDGTSVPMRYWSAAKGFPSFLPVRAQGWSPSRPSLRAFPRVLLRTIVDGEVRQSCETTKLRLDPRTALLLAADLKESDLERGDVILTGTPSGIALQVPAWKRTLGDWFLDRYGKLRAVVSSTARPDRFLRPGQRVTCEAGFLGSFSIVLEEGRVTRRA